MSPKPVHPKGNQSWIFIGRTDAEAESPLLWPRDAKNWLIGNDPDVGKDWRQEKETTADGIVGWHYWLDGHEFEQAPGVGDGQGSLVCCSPQGHKELDMNGWLNKFWFYLAVYFGQVILFFWVLELSLAKPKFWRRKWQPTPVLLPGKSHGCRSLVWWPTVHRVAKSWTQLSDFTFKPK